LTNTLEIKKGSYVFGYRNSSEGRLNMITNERQYRISKAQWSRIKEAIDAFNIEETTSRVGSRILAKAEYQALKSEEEVLSEQIREYEALKSGHIAKLKANSLKELPRILISARITQGLSQKALAKLLGVKEQQVQRYESEQYASASLKKLSQVADVLNLDIKEIAEFRESTLTTSLSNEDTIEWELFPVQEMYRRGWFKDIGFTGSKTAVLNNRIDLVREYIQLAMPRRQTAFLKYRARIGTRMDLYALWAWQCRILLLAKSQDLTESYSKTSLNDEWLRLLAQESRFDDGPRRAKKMLAQIGIPLVIEPHLPQTYLDGAAFLATDGRPIIGMTLRYDRFDNFWFVLLHELIHAMKHLRKGKVEQIFDDLDSEPDDVESEADSLAGSLLISEQDWEIALARYVRTEEAVKSFAKEHRIHPAIVAGRIRKEADNYIILKNLIGIGEVRRLFPEVHFAQ
jgi:HTH-type transcriptional regulator/antitoxin HigA